MEHAPDLKWLFVVLDDNMAAVQLDDYFGPACEELDRRFAFEVGVSGVGVRG